MSPAANWMAKSALTWAAVIAVLAAVCAGRYALVHGVFSAMPEILPSNCRPIARGLAGSGDFVVDPPHNALLIAARDGLYFLKLGALDAPPEKLAGPPADFHPGGLSLFRGPDGNETLAVIDHRADGRGMIEVYSLASDGQTAKLAQQTAIQSRLLISPHGIAAVTQDGFYVTNDHATAGALGRFAEDYLFWPHADVLLSATIGFRIAAQRIAFPSGILAKNGFLYVAAANERRIIALRIEDFTGNLSQIGALSLPARLGGISADSNGNLIVAGQTRTGSSQVFRVRLDGNGAPQSYETLFSDDGHVLKGASAAAVWNGQLFIAAADDRKMLVCPLR